MLTDGANNLGSGPMRLWHFALVAMILAPVGVTPAVADGMLVHSHHMHSSVFFSHSHWLGGFNNFNKFSSFDRFSRFSRFNRDQAFGLAGGQSFGLVGDGFFGVSGDGVANPSYIVIPPPSSGPVRMAMSRPVTEERPTVETTASGVTIIRGPGSHHLTP
jgi:hypothetical protein